MANFVVEQEEKHKNLNAMENRDNENDKHMNEPNENENLIQKNEDAGRLKNWDEQMLSKNIDRDIPHERRNLNPDREKRSGRGLNPDRNSGDR